MKHGADKILVNTSAIGKPSLLKQISEVSGQQALILQIDTRKIEGKYFCFTHGARELTTYTLSEWLKIAHDFGVGELHVTAIDSEGTRHSFPLQLAEQLANESYLPTIVSGGIRSAFDIYNLYSRFGINSFSFSSILCNPDISIVNLRNELRSMHLPVRQLLI